MICAILLTQKRSENLDGDQKPSLKRELKERFNGTVTILSGGDPLSTMSKRTSIKRKLSGAPPNLKSNAELRMPEDYYYTAPQSGVAKKIKNDKAQTRR